MFHLCVTRPSEIFVGLNIGLRYQFLCNNYHLYFSRKLLVIHTYLQFHFFSVRLSINCLLPRTYSGEILSDGDRARQRSRRRKRIFQRIYGSGEKYMLPQSCLVSMICTMWLFGYAASLLSCLHDLHHVVVWICCLTLVLSP